MTLEVYQLYRVGLWLARNLPRRWLYRVAGLIAELNFFLNRRSRRGVYANHRRVLPAATGAFRRWQLARAVFRNFAYAVADFFLIPQVSQDNLGDYLAGVNGLDYAQATAAAGHGGLLVTAHMGSWELAGASISLLDLPLSVVALEHKDPRIDQLFVSTRESAQIEVIPASGAMFKLITALKRGRFIALVSDRDVKGTGLRLPFFGQITRIPNGYARLALRTGAWILPVINYRQSDGRIKIDFHEPIVARPGIDTEESLAHRCLTIIENFIRAHPEQWLSFYDLWDETVLPVG